jgi:hypothetical protein
MKRYALFPMANQHLLTDRIGLIATPNSWSVDRGGVLYGGAEAPEAFSANQMQELNLAGAIVFTDMQDPTYSQWLEGA